MKKYLALFTVILVVATLSACKSIEKALVPTAENQIKTEEQVPAKEQTPVEQQTSAKEQVPTEQQTPAKEQVPTEQQTPAKEQIISKDEAIEFALKAAGVDKASAFDIEAELDYELGQKVWEVDFETREYDYSYDIGAYDGKISKAEREFDD